MRNINNLFNCSLVNKTWNKLLIKDFFNNLAKIK